MECAPYVVVTAVLVALSFPLSLRVVHSSIRMILGFHFLHQFNPRISWRAGTLTTEHGSRSWCLTTCPVMPVQSEVLAPLVGGDEVSSGICQPPATRRAALSDHPRDLPGSLPPSLLSPPLGRPVGSCAFSSKPSMPADAISARDPVSPVKKTHPV